MKGSIRSMAAGSLMTALMCLLSPVAIPIGLTSMTMQTFAVALAGYMLKPREALMAVGAYLLLGACGLPVFAGGSGGIGVLLGPTGGFLMGFPVMAALCARSGRCGRGYRIGMGLGGLLGVYLLGAAGMALTAGMSYRQAMLTGVAPFIWKDVLSIIGAEWMARKLGKSI